MKPPQKSSFFSIGKAVSLRGQIVVVTASVGKYDSKKIKMANIPVRVIAEKPFKEIAAAYLNHAKVLQMSRQMNALIDDLKCRLSHDLKSMRSDGISDLGIRALHKEVEVEVGVLNEASKLHEKEVESMEAFINRLPKARIYTNDEGFFTANAKSKSWIVAGGQLYASGDFVDYLWIKPFVPGKGDPLTFLLSNQDDVKNEFDLKERLMSAVGKMSDYEIPRCMLAKKTKFLQWVESVNQRAENLLEEGRQQNEITRKSEAETGSDAILDFTNQMPWQGYDGQYGRRHHVFPEENVHQSESWVESRLLKIRSWCKEVRVRCGRWLLKIRSWCKEVRVRCGRWLRKRVKNKSENILCPIEELRCTSGCIVIKLEVPQIDVIPQIDVKLYVSKFAEILAKQADLMHQMGRFHASYHQALGTRLENLLRLRVIVFGLEACEGPIKAASFSQAQQDYSNFQKERTKGNECVARAKCQRFNEALVGFPLSMRKIVKKTMCKRIKKSRSDFVPSAHQAAVATRLYDACMKGDLVQVHAELEKAKMELSALQQSAACRIMLQHSDWGAYFDAQATKLDQEIVRLAGVVHNSES